jgi:hypothetical protein
MREEGAPCVWGEEDAEHALLKCSEREIEEKNLYAING